MDKRKGMVKAVIIYAIAMIMSVASFHITLLEMFNLIVVCVPFAAASMISSDKEAGIAFIVSLIVLMLSTDRSYAIGTCIMYIMPSLIIGRITVLGKDRKSNEPVYIGMIIYMLSIITYALISKYMMNTDVVKVFIDTINKSVESRTQSMTPEQLEMLGNVDKRDIVTLMRNMVAVFLFIHAMICSMITYYVGVALAKRTDEVSIQRGLFSEFFLPGNPILFTAMMFLALYAMKYMELNIMADVALANLQVIFNVLFSVQGISVGVYYIINIIRKKSRSLFLPSIILIIMISFGGSVLMSIVGLLDCVMDFRKLRKVDKKSI